MKSSAHVTSLDEMRAARALSTFLEGSRDALTMLELETRRALRWLDEDRAKYWPDQVKRASRALVEARNELERCELQYGSDPKPSCLQQRKAYERAKARLRLCEEKVRQVKRWRRLVGDELEEFRSRMAQMTNYLDGELPRGMAGLSRMIVALEKYAESSGARSARSVGLAGDASLGEIDDISENPE